MRPKNNNQTKELTKAELELMRILWKKKQAFLGEIVEGYPEENRPAYPTVQTVVRILEKKGFVKHESFSKIHRYYPVVSKERYRSGVMNQALHVFFDNSPVEMFSFLAEKGSLTASQYDELKEVAKKILEK